MRKQQADKVTDVLRWMMINDRDTDLVRKALGSSNDSAPGNNRRHTITESTDD